MDIYDCGRCGRCCRELIIEAEILDVLREPRIIAAAPFETSAKKLPPIIDLCWVLGPRKGLRRCVFLAARNTCSIYGTRPNSCVEFPAGGARCRRMRREAGLPPLRPRRVKGSDLLARIKQFVRQGRHRGA